MMLRNIRRFCFSTIYHFRTYLLVSRFSIYNVLRITTSHQRKGNILLGITFPWSVHALGWGKPKDENKVFDDPNCMKAKLSNKNDKELIRELEVADSMYKESIDLTHKNIYDNLLKHKDKREAELYWRLARVTYELFKLAESTSQKSDLVEEAFKYVKTALEIDDTNFAAHKWMAIILNQISTMKGTKEQITQSYNVRHHMDKAVELNPKDATSMYLVGNWCFTVAGIPWYQRKVAETIFAKPPTCSFNEAVQYFLKAEEIQPKFYSMNLLMLAKSFIELGDLEKAEQYLNLVNDTPITTDEDYKAQKEAGELLRRIKKN